MSEKWDEKVIELAKSLINCQSYSGHEDKAAEALKWFADYWLGTLYRKGN